MAGSKYMSAEESIWCKNSDQTVTHLINLGKGVSGIIKTAFAVRRMTDCKYHAVIFLADKKHTKHVELSGMTISMDFDVCPVCGRELGLAHRDMETDDETLEEYHLDGYAWKNDIECDDDDGCGWYLEWWWHDKITVIPIAEPVCQEKAMMLAAEYPLGAMIYSDMALVETQTEKPGKTDKELFSPYLYYFEDKKHGL